ncbi:MAG: hypothetical protein GXY33_05640 [Phycisphaerae bacterium]|nr:hypothetical protein [Phycisphaerae bacterium]
MKQEAGCDGRKWEASWIWHPGRCWSVNDHILARRRFEVEGRIERAVCRISAHTDYLLLINGRYVGRGPTPCDPWFQEYDGYDVTSLLETGGNAIAVIGHNYGIGFHGQHRHQAGLIVQLDVQTDGGPQTVCTDGSWRTRRADAYGDRSPRMFWSCGFMETFDFRQVEDGWEKAEFDDLSWSAPEVFGPHPTRPWQRLIPRGIPLLRERFVEAQDAVKGGFTLDAVHAVRFDGILPPSREGIVYAETTIRSEREREVVLHVECDDAYRLFVNGRLQDEKSYSIHFARTRVWRGKDEYEQVHYGMGTPGRRVKVKLAAGENRVLMAVDHGKQGWGVAMVPLDPASGLPAELECSPDGWRLAGPTESTGANDSLAAVRAELSDVREGVRSTYDPHDYTDVTDYATLMRYERRGEAVRCPGPDGVRLAPGEFCVIDLGKVRVGYPQLDLCSNGEGILDVGYAQLEHRDHAIRFSNAGNLKYVDRVHTRKATQTWQPLHRRTGRYIHLSNRGGAPIEIVRSGMVTVGYPVEYIAAFECSDPLLNRIWEVSRYTTELLMQYGYQDCLKREQGTFNTSSFNYMSRAAGCCFGDYALARQAFRLAARTQNESGWFDSHGLSSPNNDEYTECLWWIVWLRDHYLFSGDRQLAEEMFEVVEDNLRFFAKATNERGLLNLANMPIQRPGCITYLDDSLSRDEGYVGIFDGELSGLNILYGAALEAAAGLAEHLGQTDRAAFYTRKAQRVKTAVCERLWSEQFGRFANFRRNDELASIGHPIIQIAALYFGYHTDGQRDRLLRYLCDEFGLPDENVPNYPLHTFGFYFYFVENLFRHDRVLLAYELIRRYYGRWLELGATTFGEFFRLSDWKGKDRLGEEYEVHGYGTSAHLHFYTNILGVQPARSGFAEILIRPCPGDLAFARGKVHTPRGIVGVAWESRDGILDLEVEVPEGCAWRVEKPYGFSQVHVSGRETAE